MLLDDKHDIGRFSYYNRTDYYWKGKYSPDHPSPLHHWYFGWLGMLFAQIGAIAMKGLEVAQTYESVQRGDLSGIDAEVLEMFDETPVSLNDYNKEISCLPLEIDSAVLSDSYTSRSSIPIPKIKLLL